MVCVICHFTTVLDDVVISGKTRCVCVRCFNRETHCTLPMPPKLQREIEYLVNIAIETW